MKKVWIAVMGLAMTLVVGAGCSSKPSCELLYKRQKKCAKGKKKDKLDKDVFMVFCKKLKDKPSFKAQIACSKHSDCDKFRACVEKSRKAQRLERLKKRWAKVKKEMDAGKYTSAEVFCSVWKKDLEGEMKAVCKDLPVKAFDALYKDITAKRDKGQVDYKSTNCYRLKSYAKKAGGDRVKKADALCAEVKAVRRFQQVKKSVDKRMAKLKSAFLPYGCAAKDIKKVAGIGTPFAKKLTAKFVDLCYKKFAVAIMKKKVPGQRYCKVGMVYKAVLAMGVKSPELDKLMEEAGKKCKK